MTLIIVSSAAQEPSGWPSLGIQRRCCAWHDANRRRRAHSKTLKCFVMFDALSCRPPHNAARAQVWALAVTGAREEAVATGGGDAVVALWRDATAANAEAKATEQAAVVLKQQDLENALQVSSSCDRVCLVATQDSCLLTACVNDLNVAPGSLTVRIFSATSVSSCFWTFDARGPVVVPAIRFSANGCAAQLLTVTPQAEDYAEAASLAFELRQPRRLLAVVSAAAAPVIGADATPSASSGSNGAAPGAGS